MNEKRSVEELWQERLREFFVQCWVVKRSAFLLDDGYFDPDLVVVE